MLRHNAAHLGRNLVSQPQQGCLNALRQRWREGKISNWHELLLARGWLRPDFHQALAEEQEAAISLLSSALTYPLTMAFAHREILLSGGHQHIPGPAAAPRWCVIGARAERTLPPHIWAELCVLSPSTRCTLNLAGLAPVPPVTPHERHLREPALSIHQLPGGSPFHDTSLGRAVLAQESEATGFVLFNPGLGEPGWGGVWAPTLRAISQSGKPIVLTALSVDDAARDLAFWRATIGDGVHEPCYAANPWGSLIAGTACLDSNAASACREEQPRSNNCLAVVGTAAWASRPRQ